MNKSLLALTLLCGALANPSHAAGEHAALKNSNVVRLGADDLALMRARVMQALKTGADGETLDWKSEKSKASGSVTALSRSTSNGLSCRRVRIVNVIGAVSRQGVYRFCEKPAGRWKLVGPDKDQR